MSTARNASADPAFALVIPSVQTAPSTSHQEPSAERTEKSVTGLCGLAWIANSLRVAATMPVMRSTAALGRQ